jgi:DNA replication and repair protein RecF
LLIGENAQGKTNLLEAVYLVATLRSFRGVGGAQMIRHGQRGYFVGAAIIATDRHQVKMYWSPDERRLDLDGRPVRRLGDYLGTLRAVVFCTEDLQLVKGTARVRRRFVDLLLSQTQPGYLAWLQRYMQTWRSRNALLRRRDTDEAALESFSHELVRSGNELIRLRREMIPRLSPLARLAFRRIAPSTEELALEYAPSVQADFAIELAQSRRREETVRSTLVGPHRDDMRLLVNGQCAARFASEGQKRTVAIALKMAQAEYVAGIQGTPPLLLIDDVMGELDQKRRAGFLPLLQRMHEKHGQVFMTCTDENWPRDLGLDLHRSEIRAGTISVVR